MLSVRPAESAHYLKRPRLLQRLPEEAGYCVWLEAPYGYGKSILASQWALLLEEQGWRVLWLSHLGRDSRSSLSQRFGLPPSAPWEVLFEQLWSIPTLLVLEDLDGTGDLSPLLKNIGGLLLLASRQHLPYPALAQLHTAGRLTHLGHEELAFSRTEADELFGGDPQAPELWRQTGGWPLPLHFASLSNSLPAGVTLLEGVKRSVSVDAWRELLFLAAAERVTDSAATDATHELARAGFVQVLADAFRLHPLVGEMARAAFPAEVGTQLESGTHRLTPHELGLARERAGHETALIELLRSGAGALEQQQPEDFLRWHGLVPDDGSSERRLHATIARLLLDRLDEALPAVTSLMELPSLEPGRRVRLAGIAVNVLAGAKRFEAAEVFARQLRELIPGLAPHDAGAAWQGLVGAAYMRGRFEEAEEYCRLALDAYAQAEGISRPAPAELRARANLCSLAFDTRGEIEGPLAEQLNLLASGGLDNVMETVLRQNAAVNLALLNDIDGAVEQVERALGVANAYGKVLLEAMLAYLTLDLAAFPRILAAARRWEQREMAERASALWLRALRRSGDLHTAFEVRERLQSGPFTDLEMLWAYAGSGDSASAHALLDATRDAYPYREYALHWHAANYLLNRTDEALEQLLSLTRIGARILPYVGMPLSALPPSRPQLARVYPLREVLESGWIDAVRVRTPEIPPLEVTLLGRVSARVLGVEVPLTERQRQLLALLVLGLSREQVAEEMWPETDPLRQRNNVNVQLNLLRKALEPWGVPTFLFTETLRSTRSDYGRLVAALGDGDAATVFESYREPFAGGLALDTLIEEQRQLRERTVRLLHAAAAEAEGGKAADYLRRVLELEPLKEDALQDLLLLLVTRGRRHEARERYERFARQLMQETGLQPSPRTTELATGTGSA